MKNMGFIEDYMRQLNLAAEQARREAAPAGYYDALPTLRELESELYDLSTNSRFTFYDDDDNESVDVKGIVDFLTDLMALGDMASNVLRELTDPESIPSPDEVIE
tara:strand:+ start:226 stop:540 length:315 start_codon:yes stop_codon:yes gene_type:complete